MVTHVAHTLVNVRRLAKMSWGGHEILTSLCKTDISLGRGGGNGMWAVWGFGMQTVIFGMDEQRGPTVQHREACVIGSLCCTTETEETL